MNPVSLGYKYLGCRYLTGLVVIPIGLCSAFPAVGESEASQDWQHRIESSQFEQTASNVWTSLVVKPPFAFDELIYSWHFQDPGDTFRLYLQVEFASNDLSDWLYAGFWGDISDVATSRQAPKFDRGTLDMDFLKLTTRASGYRFKVVGDGTNSLSGPPALTVVVTEKHSSQTNIASQSETPATLVLDVPLRRQLNAAGSWMKDRCQSAALASAMEYYGKSVLLEDIVHFTNDPEYNYPGIWPRVIAAAQEFGFDGYIDRFRDWDTVRRTLAENKMILCSIRMKLGQCKSPPYPSMGNHIVVLCGVTEDGRVVVTDSALGKSGNGYLCQWLQSDFEKIWMQTKGGIAMVICPPSEAKKKLVANLPPFPSDRKCPTDWYSLIANSRKPRESSPTAVR